MSEHADRPKRRAASFGALTALAAGLTGAVWWSGTLAAPENLLALSYRNAIADVRTGMDDARLTPAALEESEQPKPIEAIWPGPSTEGLTFHRPLKVGDRITISSRKGKPDRLAVVELQQIDGAGIGAPGMRFQLVTSRHVGSADERLVRFLIAVDDTPAPVTNKTL